MILNSECLMLALRQSRTAELHSAAGFYKLIWVEISISEPWFSL
jgi:hypothetical protein